MGVASRSARRGAARMGSGMALAVLLSPPPPPALNASDSCRSTCGCFETELCPALYDASADSAAVWTCIELLLLAVLCWLQGLWPLDVPARFLARLRLGLTGRTPLDETLDQLVRTQPQRSYGPTLANAPRLLLDFLLGSAGLLCIGLRSGFFCRPPDLSQLVSSEALLVLPIPLVFPGLIEECFWRFMILPAPSEMTPRLSSTAAKMSSLINATFAGWSVQHLIALAGFVVYHMDMGHFHPRHIFVDRRFLAMATILGVACTDAAITTRTVWIPTLFHGLWVWSWLACMGRC